ncbi:MerR family transcriptional regulator [Nocardioides sp. MH1]|uniref:MerR family transcriptional regulator n=1 Tax=Nocardioides sp. MH1 TaxID=3242490 RepID=UPI003522FA48
MYPIKRAAELVGTSVSTLRAWDGRYGVGASRRSEHGYRLYDDDDVRRLRAMRDLVDRGWSVRAAAEEVRMRAARPQPVTPGEALSPEGATDRFVAAAADYDAAAIGALLDEQFGNATFERVVDGWLLPALRELGAAWESGRVSVAAEHLAANAVVRRLAMTFEAAASLESGPRVVLGLPCGSRHDIGLLAFATAARRAGLVTTFLGADVPVADWSAAVGAQRPDCVVLAVPTAEDAEATAAVVAAVGEARPGVLVAVGGSAQDQAPDGCLRLGHRIGPAAVLLAHALERRVTRG